MTEGLPLPPERAPDTHKGAMGRLLAVGGSRGLAGALHLMVGGALRGGSGYVVAAMPADLGPGLTVAHPEVVQLPVETQAGRFAAADVEALLPELDRCDAVALGPGIGLDLATQDFVLDLLHTLARARPGLGCVVDADALSALAAADRSGGLRWEALNRLALVLTPHPGEAARLLGWSGAEEVQRDRVAAWQGLVARSGATVLLKGAGTLVGGPGQSEAWVNPTGNPGMATAGSGDVLTGLVGALLARGMNAPEAARLAAWLHGRAGDLAAQEGSPESLIARDLLGTLPRAWRALGPSSSTIAD